MSAPNMTIMVHVHDKIVAVCCGSGSQRLQWLGHVAIARYDASNEQGWMQFGTTPPPSMQCMPLTTWTCRTTCGDSKCQRRRISHDRHCMRSPCGQGTHLRRHVADTLTELSLRP
ncbi:hypothetical protein H257_15962 [Aphanomyces astaci]|uniref:Uncharacterized protein n=1 Tax=Aphanomyces astaci TaxID=112090 RepID=W4FMF3_APHAT|nr:hypothetical protein H257_15962 [Aphanomyces astaci]ETV68009.1 hypothetical protein H257_15962 [Aphanomyces astaci]|eukprot:XP_009842572.1 hypothetical protein H257_15962 [Aphanomyces astaci]